MLICFNCKKKFDDIDKWVEHNKECKSVGYTIIKDFSKKVKPVKKNVLKDEPKDAELQVSDIPKDIVTDKISKTITGKKSQKKNKK